MKKEKKRPTYFAHWDDGKSGPGEGANRRFESSAPKISPFVFRPACRMIAKDSRRFIFGIIFRFVCRFSVHTCADDPVQFGFGQFKNVTLSRKRPFEHRPARLTDVSIIGSGGVLGFSLILKCHALKSRSEETGL